MKNQTKFGKATLVGTVLLISACSGGSRSPEPPPPNVAPSAISQNVTIDEDVNLSLTLSGTDSDGTIARYTITTQPANGSITGSGANFIYTPNVDFNGTDSLQFTVTDNDASASNAATINITVNPVNDAPVVALLDTFEIAENSTSTGALLASNASDPEQDAFTFALGQQADSALFEIDAATSEIKFVNAPDFEAPTDADTNNIYQVEVVYTDVNDASTAKLIDILVTDESNIQLSMTYPTPNANLGAVTQTTVRGVISDLEDGEVLTDDLSQVQINGEQTTLEINDGKWSSTLAISAETTAITLETYLNGVRLSQVEYSLKAVAPEFYLEIPLSALLDRANNRFIVYDFAYASIFAVDLTTQAVTLLSGSDFGTGVELERVRGMTLDTANNRLFVIDDEQDDLIIEVDLNNGNRRVVSGTFIDNSQDDIGDGPQLSNIYDIAYFSGANSLLILTRTNENNSGGFSPAIVEIDILTGNRTILSNIANGTGPDFSLLYGIVIDSIRPVAYVTDLIADKILSVDLLSGDRSIITDSGSVGVDFERPTRLGLNADNTKLFVLVESDEAPSVMSVDLSTQQRTLLSNTENGNGLDLVTPREIVVGDTSNDIWVFDSGVEGILSIDMNTGDRNAVTTINPSLLVDPTNIVMDTANQRILLSDEERILSAKLPENPQELADITEVTSMQTGTGPTLGYYNLVAIDEANNRAFAVDIDRTVGRFSRMDEKILVEIDLDTGNRTELFDFNTFNGFSDIDAIQYHAPTNRIIYLESHDYTIMAFDLDTQTFSLIASNVGGESPEDTTTVNLGIPITFEIDVQNNRAIVSILQYLDINENGLFVSGRQIAVESIDLSSGQSETLMNDSIGTGPTLEYLDGLTIDNQNNRIFATARDIDQVIAIDLATGNRTIISDTNENLPLIFPTNPIFDELNQRLFIADATHERIYVIDIATGERAIFAQ